MPSLAKSHNYLATIVPKEAVVWDMSVCVCADPILSNSSKDDQTSFTDCWQIGDKEGSKVLKAPTYSNRFKRYCKLINKWINKHLPLLRAPE